jgi:hypothetical protein
MICKRITLAQTKYLHPDVKPVFAEAWNARDLLK